MTLMMIMSIVTCVVYGFTARYVFLALMTGGIWGAYSQILAYTAQVFQNRPHEVRAMSIGLITTVVNTGNIYGSYLFPKEDAPKYLLGFGVVSGTAAISIFTYSFIWYMERKRLRREE
jgi:predicted MFS family arabinose efflux permease